MVTSASLVQEAEPLEVCARSAQSPATHASARRNALCVRTEPTCTKDAAWRGAQMAPTIGATTTSAASASLAPRAARSASARVNALSAMPTTTSLAIGSASLQARHLESTHVLKDSGTRRSAIFQLGTPARNAIKIAARAHHPHSAKNVKMLRTSIIRAGASQSVRLAITSKGPWMWDAPALFAHRPATFAIATLNVPNARTTPT